MRKLTVLLFAALAAGQTRAQPSFQFWPGASYDPAIPTIRQVLGHEPGERITPAEGLVRYLEALAAASPRLKVLEYGQSWEGRKLVYAAIGSEANMKRLPEIRAGMQKLADPRKTSAAEAEKLIQGLPAVVWLAYGVHGNEISSSDAALLTAYHLLAARKDTLVDQVLAKVVVLIDPTQNPDGRSRFIANFEQSLGAEADASPLAAEHNEPWPGGRTNHYLFDLNRDWLVATQPEIQTQVAALLQWFPLVYADLHEMGSNSTYYFSPEADPYNPNLTKDQHETLKLFGRNNARWFDQFGFDYFTREVYDAFYPGYGASWPSYYGGIATTYEQASVRGLAVRRSDDTVLAYRDSVQHHFVASVSTAETAARDREKLLRDFYSYRRSAIQEGSTEQVREYILVRGQNYSAADKLAGVLVEQGVEVRRATAAFQSGGREYPAGSYAVTLAQPAKRLIRTMLDPHTGMDEPFIKEQERRRRKKLPDQIYDVTAWSLPLMFNVEAVARPEVSSGSFELVQPARFLPAALKGRGATVAYLAPWGSAAAGRLLAAAHRAGLRVFSSDKPFKLNGTAFPSGTLIFKVKSNPADLADQLARLAAATGADVYPTNTGWVDEGVNFGSSEVVYLPRPSIALAWDRPAAASSAGWTRFVLERQFGYPVTPIRTAQLAGADLRNFKVLILPDEGGGSYLQMFNTEQIAQLKAWVSAGGTLIGISGALSFLADSKVGLLAITEENAARPPEPGAAAPADAQKKPEENDGRVPGKFLASDADYRKAIEATKELPDTVPGVLLRARVDTESWIGAGVSGTVYALFEGREIFTPVALNKGINAAVFEAPDKVLASGYLWEENRKQLARKPLVVVQPQGRGVVVGFTTDPNFRASLDGMNILFLNAVFRGPAHARPAVGEE